MSEVDESWVPTVEDVLSAARRLDGVVRHTPLLTCEELDRHCEAKILLKAESLQLGGSFKLRGAYNRLCMLDGPGRAGGVVAWSSGNHAIGVATAARMLGVPATIVMPSDAPRVKLEQTKALGAEIVLYDRYSQSREGIARSLAESKGAVLVPSFDDPWVIAGQGTVGVEVVAEAGRLGLTLDEVLICCGGGGLAAGCALAICSLSPSTSISVVEPEHYDDTTRSLVSGRREEVGNLLPSICDALLAPTPGALTFPINRALVTRGVVVSADDVLNAMRFAFRVLKLVVEPGGAVALAAVLSNRVDVRGRTVAVTLSGGNVDPELFARAIAATP